MRKSESEKRYGVIQLVIFGIIISYLLVAVMVIA